MMTDALEHGLSTVNQRGRIRVLGGVDIGLNL